MIYTIGRTSSYERGFREEPMMRKIGRRPGGVFDIYPNGYPGGSVWETREAADAYLKANRMRDYSVYGVAADWKTQTEPSKSDGGWHDLLEDADLVRLEPA